MPKRFFNFILYEKMNNYIIRLDSQRLGYGKVVLSNPSKTHIPQGITVVFGENGSGKTTLGNILAKGKNAYGNRITFRNDINSIRILAFTDIHALSGMEAQYQSQRMEATMNDMVPTVREIMGTKIHDPKMMELSYILNINDVIDKKINYLSSGELRKLLIINALLDNPDVLILDNPYIGLDPVSRCELNNMMEKLKEDGLSIILILCDAADIPIFTDAVITLDNLTISQSIQDKRQISDIRNHDFEESSLDINILKSGSGNLKTDHKISFSIIDGHIRYGERQILKNINWEVKKGEKWVLTGSNGSGKSLLLSLICADNPQAYANDITLFDRKRGSGESIWEIKDAIGYVSPEMQLFFESNSYIKEIIAQGLRNSLNKYLPLTDEEITETEIWMRILGISHLADRRFTELSTGEQRLVLVARAMIKQPALLVLDEPLHGLDARNKKRVIKIVNDLTERNGSSLIFVTHYENEIPDCVSNTMALTKR